MSKVAHYLQQHVIGEVLTTPDVRKFFATDGSVFTVTPSVIIYPRNENDIRKTTRFTWQLAERGRVIPITSRGMGTDQSGAAIGDGIMLVFPAHMNRILELDGKTGLVTVEPGINYGKLQQTLHTHGRFLPPYPSSIEFSTIGGAIANNASGEKTVKYGSTRAFVKKLRVVLANGEVIETRRLSKRELDKKLGLTTLEGEIYRAMDALIEENSQLIKDFRIDVSKNSAGYDIFDVKHKDGSFDLSSLIVGSQGTLGIVSEAVLDTAPHNPDTTLIAAFFDDIQVAEQVIQEIRKFPETPSALELVDENLLKFVDAQNPNQLKGIVDKPYPKLVVLIEFDNLNQRLQKRMARKTTKLLTHNQVPFKLETDELAKDRLWKIRHASALVSTHSEGNARAVPIIEDGIVPAERFGEYITGVYLLFEKYHLQPAIWGHAGDANLHIQPLLDLSQVGDRQKVFRLMDEYHELVISLGGSTTGEHGDGRLRGPYLKKLYGDDIYAIFQKIKVIFDPYNTLNPGVKINVSLDDIKPLLRQEYSITQAHHLPHN
jgi:FAD/FMN-containing dehydrogenase